MQLTHHATRRTPHGASRLVQAMSAWAVKTRRAPSRHCGDARVYDLTTTAMHEHGVHPTPDLPPPPSNCLCMPCKETYRIQHGEHSFCLYNVRFQCYDKGFWTTRHKPYKTRTLTPTPQPRADLYGNCPENSGKQEYFVGKKCHSIIHTVVFGRFRTKYHTLINWRRICCCPRAFYRDLWQGIVIAGLAKLQLIHEMGGWTAENVEKGIQDLLVCVEMLIIAVAHTTAFSSGPYEDGATRRDGASLLEAHFAHHSAIRDFNEVRVAKQRIRWFSFVPEFVPFILESPLFGWSIEPLRRGRGLVKS